MDSRKQEVLRFLSNKSLIPTAAWIEAFIDQTRSQSNTSTLQQTALYRLLSSDLTLTLERASYIFPANIANPSIVTLRVPGPVVTQLIDLEDIGSSSWSQIEAIESHEKGETTRGNQVIRTVPDENGEINPPPKSKGPHKLLLEDAAGTKVYAFETKPIDKIEIGCSMSIKLVLKDLTIARGVIMLRPENVTVLGGKINTHDTAWQAGRKQRLNEKLT